MLESEPSAWVTNGSAAGRVSGVIDPIAGDIAVTEN
jgi:hypothetical protein